MSHYSALIKDPMVLNRNTLSSLEKELICPRSFSYITDHSLSFNHTKVRVIPIIPEHEEVFTQKPINAYLIYKLPGVGEEGSRKELANCRCLDVYHIQSVSQLRGRHTHIPENHFRSIRKR